MHWILSFDKNVSHQVADVVGQEVLMLLKEEYQAIMATHINTANPHNHYLINPINLMTGRKFSESIKDMLIFREKINDILNRHGLKKIGLSDTFCEEDLDDGLPLSERSDLSELNHLKNIGQGTFMYMEIINFPNMLTQEPIKPFITKDTPLVKPFTVSVGKKPFTIHLD